MKFFTIIISFFIAVFVLLVPAGRVHADGIYSGYDNTNLPLTQFNLAFGFGGHNNAPTTLTLYGFTFVKGGGSTDEWVGWEQSNGTPPGTGCTLVPGTIPVGTTTVTLATPATVVNDAGIGVLHSWTNSSCSGAEADSIQSAGTGGDTYRIFYFSPLTPPVPPGDGDASTHVIRMTSPAAYSTVTSPFSMGFDAIVGEQASTTDGYVITLRDEANGWIAQQYFGLLPSFTVGVPFSVSTTTLTHATSTSLTVDIQLVGGMQDHISYGTPVYYQPNSIGLPIPGTNPFAVGGTYFSVSNPVPLPPYVGTGYTSSDCNWDFTTPLNFGSCIAYLVAPSATSTAQFSTISLSGRFPFVYAFQTQSYMNALFNSTSTASTTIGVTFAWFNHSTTTVVLMRKSTIDALPYASILKSIFTGFMWLLTVYTLYRIILKSHNKETGV